MWISLRLTPITARWPGGILMEYTMYYRLLYFGFGHLWHDTYYLSTLLQLESMLSRIRVQCHPKMWGPMHQLPRVFILSCYYLMNLWYVQLYNENEMFTINTVIVFWCTFMCSCVLNVWIMNMHFHPDLPSLMPWAWVSCLQSLQVSAC